MNKTKLVKTEYCKNIIETGNCSYKDKCLFAHSESEKIERKRHPRYKTEYCENMLNYGHCNYGLKCSFRHDTENYNKKSTLEDINKVKKKPKPEKVYLDVYIKKSLITKKERKKNLIYLPLIN